MICLTLNQDWKVCEGVEERVEEREGERGALTSCSLEERSLCLLKWRGSRWGGEVSRAPFQTFGTELFE